MGKKILLQITDTIMSHGMSHVSDGMSHTVMIQTPLSVKEREQFYINEILIDYCQSW